MADGHLITSDGPLEPPSRVLVVVAHPDDVDFGCAGTIAHLTDLGSHVAYCLVTSGDAGDDDMTVPQVELAALREAEQTAAASRVGVTELHWLRRPDGMVEAGLELRRDISRVIRLVRPDVVITQSPERTWDSVYASHPDHLATGQSTLDAVYPDARNPRAFPELLAEGLSPHTVPDVWVFSREGALFVDITDTFPRKLAALKAHASQIGKMDDLETMIEDWGSRIAKAGSLPAGRLAEGFRQVRTV
ncbi:MAG: PIG-L family deacetylase [Acidimicrobiia bacterium]|nr:PIG-L family deacetylase [Acidimicrobiia bacterium]